MRARGGGVVWARFAAVVTYLVPAMVVLCIAPGAPPLSPALRAQEWNAPRALELAQRAVQRRSGQIAATTIASYSAEAKGYLTFLGSLGDTALLRPKVIKQTQLAVQVYWQAPGSSKQVVVGMRDTLLTPADVEYYADRYGIVQSNFPDRIRLGDGRDVSDVIHPLSPAGLELYDFAIGDSISIATVNQRIDVYQLRFRPREPAQPRAMGSAYLDVRTADIVRLNLTFTRAAILDRRIEHLTVSLENMLVEERAWLPRQQLIEVVRTGTWLRFEGRGIIRGRWDVCCYDVAFAPAPALFTGPPIVFLPQERLRAYPFEGGVLDGLPPGVSVVRPEDLEQVQREAENMVRLKFREQTYRAAVSVPRVSDVIRVTRAEGIAAGAAGVVRPFTRVDLAGRVRYGIGDEEWKGEGSVRLNLGRDRALRVFAMRDYVDARDVAEGSGVRNTLAAQEFGSDYTDPYDVVSNGVELTLGRVFGVRWRVMAAHEEHERLPLRATSERGEYEPLIPARGVRGKRVSLYGEGVSARAGRGMVRLNSEVRLTEYDSRAMRVKVDVEYERPAGAGVLTTRTIAAALSGGDVAPQLFVFFGGPVTAPGYEIGAFGARRGVSQRVEWRRSVPFFGMSLGRFGRTPKRATIAPYLHMTWVDDALKVPGWPDPMGIARPVATAPIVVPPPGTPPPPYPVRGDRQGWYPAIGFGFEPLLEVVRFDVARGLRDGRWTFSFDVGRAFWDVL